jgi:hypothetical protein
VLLLGVARGHGHWHSSEIEWCVWSKGVRRVTKAICYRVVLAPRNSSHMFWTTSPFGSGYQEPSKAQLFVLDNFSIRHDHAYQELPLAWLYVSWITKESRPPMILSSFNTVVLGSAINKISTYCRSGLIQTSRLPNKLSLNLRFGS